MLEQILTSMFNYDNLPKGLDKKFIEHTLIRFGCCAIVKINDEYFVGVPALMPPLDNYGIGTEIVVTTYNGQYQKRGKIGEQTARRYGLVQRVCSDYIRTYKDVLIYDKNYKLTPLDREFITELCAAKRKFMRTPCN